MVYGASSLDVDCEYGREPLHEDGGTAALCDTLPSILVECDYFETREIHDDPLAAVFEL